RMPLPQISVDLQSALQRSPLTVLPSSQTSRLLGSLPLLSRIPLPQLSSDLQSRLQPSPSWMLPSSQTSPLPLSTVPLPQVSEGGMQTFCTAAQYWPTGQTSPSRQITLCGWKQLPTTRKPPRATMVQVQFVRMRFSP